MKADDRAGEGFSSPGWACEVHDTLPSTSDEAIMRAERGDAAPLAILARRQTRGRGSRGRRWEDPPAGNLALSVLLRPPMAASALGPVVFASALAMIEALDPHAGSGRLSLKWPNDVLVDDAKVGGILVESAVDDGRVRWLVIGFGANLAARPPLVSGDRAVGCLADRAGVVGAVAVANGLLRRLDHWMGAPFETVRTAWLARAHPPGTVLTVDGRTCRFVGLAADGALLADDDGATRRVSTRAVFERAS